MKKMSLWFCPIRNPQPYEHDRILEELSQLEIDFKEVQLNDVKLQLTSNRSELYLDDQKLEFPDVAWVRVGPLYTNAYERAVATALESNVHLCINPRVGRMISDQKFWTLQVLSRHNIPIPKTIITPLPFSAPNIEQELKYPMVLKPDQGARGLGVMLIENRKQLQSVGGLLEYFKTDEAIVLQEYIAFNPGSDIRVWVLGDKVLGAMRRTSSGDTFTSNFSAGGNVEKVEVTEFMTDIALRATSALGLTIAGVDLLETQDGYVVCEVNANPGFKGFERATDVNVPREVLTYLLNKFQEK